MQSIVSGHCVCRSHNYSAPWTATDFCRYFTFELRALTEKYFLFVNNMKLEVYTYTEYSERQETTRTMKGW